LGNFNKLQNAQAVSLPPNAENMKLYFACLFLITSTAIQSQTMDPDFRQAVENGKLVNQGFNRCIAYVNAWMKHADSSTGLIPRNITDSKDFWNAWDAAADNYPFMVLTSSILMPEFFKGKALDMLKTERRLTSRIGKLPDTYSFSKKGFKNGTIDTNQLIFGAAEYMKDGLIPLTEWLGKSPWSKRMLEILDDLPLLTRVAKNIHGNWYGSSATVEVNGDLLQVLSRMYWFTGKRKYLDWAVEIADNYLNEKQLPTRALDHLRIRDHGCEIISGLCEAYIATYYAMPEKRKQWKPFVHEMLDRILEVGRNEDGLFYDEVNPQNGKILSARLADNFGYTLNAYWFISNIDSMPAYRNAVIKAISSLNKKYRNHNWEGGSADGYADAIEGTLNLYNREPIASVKDWLDSEIKAMWAIQKSDGMVEGWHGDGNFARTSIMYCLWKTQGIVPLDWDGQLSIGAVQTPTGLKIAVSSPVGWKGKLKFDVPRHSSMLHYPADYPRINQYQEWFVVEKNLSYHLKNIQAGTLNKIKGSLLAKGLEVKVKAGETIFLEISSK
jgi:hypothetical protein